MQDIENFLDFECNIPESVATDDWSDTGRALRLIAQRALGSNYAPEQARDALRLVGLAHRVVAAIESDPDARDELVANFVEGSDPSTRDLIDQIDDIHEGRFVNALSRAA